MTQHKFTLRPEQRAVVDKVLAAFDSGFDTVILKAPTGSGKSIIAKTVTEKFYDSYILTPTTALQDQYAKDFEGPDFKVFKGKTHYDCALSDTTVAEAACQHDKTAKQIKKCREASICPYYSAREDAITSRCTLLNFQGYLVWRQIGLKQTEPFFSMRSLHVVDEAHRIEDCAAEALSIRLKGSYLRMLLKHRRHELPEIPESGTPEEAAALLATIKDLLKKTLDDWAAANNVSVSTLIQIALESEKAFPKVLKILELEAKIEAIGQEGSSTYALGFGKEDSTKTKKGTSENFFFAKPTKVANYIRSMVLGRKTLLTSATLPMTETWASDLGIENYTIIEMESTFPASNRPVWFTTVGSMRRGGDKRLVKETATKIKAILAKFPEVKGMIHTPSYAYGKMLENELKDVQRIVWCGPGEETKVKLRDHEISRAPLVLASPAVREGVDFRDDLSRFQIIIKAPFDSLGDPAIKMKSEKNPQWYSMRTMTNFLQMYGRSIRTPTDSARTYILDEDLKDFLNKNRKHVPKYVLDAIHW